MVGADGWTHVRPNPKPNARACPVFRAKITPRGPWGATVMLMIGPSISKRTVEQRMDLLQSSYLQRTWGALLASTLRLAVNVPIMTRHIAAVFLKLSMRMLFVFVFASFVASGQRRT